MDTLLDRLLVGLNEAQRAAVTSEAKVLQVLAPPGSGKTKTLTSRAAYLIARHGLNPRNIILCTFTVKAAREMQQRICTFLGDEVAKQLRLGTFHSIARRYLSIYGKHIGLDEKFAIADTSDSTSILKRIIKRNGYSLQPAKARSKISSLKAQHVTADQFAASNKTAHQQEFAVVYMQYEEYLQLSKLLDFDDLLLRCEQLFREYPHCVSKIEAVLIDEFQDTNKVQYELMRLFAQKCKTITTVGDPDQSIYGWRSAEIENLMKMQRDYPEIHIATLEENYRSSGAILLTAQEVIEQDSSRPAKQLVPTHSVGMRPVMRKLKSANHEARWIVLEIQRIAALTAGLFKWSDCAILLRSASLSRLVEKQLGAAAIPYRMVGGLRFFDRMEIKLVLDYLCIINFPDYNDALARVINVPARKVGETTIQKLLSEAQARKVSAWSLARGVTEGKIAMKGSLQAATQKGIQAFVELVLRARKILESTSTSEGNLKEFIEYVLGEIHLEEHLKLAKSEDHETRWANVQELLALASDFDVQKEATLDADEIVDEVEDDADDAATLDEVLTAFLSNVTLSSEIERSREKDCPQDQVVISTIHAAKGLEWPVVFIPGAYDGSVPHSRTENVDEERRLLYVAMTRAQALLYISVPETTSTGDVTVPSRFLIEKSLEAYFDKFGPSFSLEVAKEMAQILRRAAPPIKAIEQILLEFPRVKDTDEVFDANEGYQSKRHFDEYEEDEAEASQGWGSGAKHCRVESEHFRRSRLEPSNEASSKSYYRAPTTMQQASHFSTASRLHSTFQSASTAMMNLKQVQPNCAGYAAEPESSVSRLSKSPVKNPNSKQAASTSQTSILSFVSGSRSRHGVDSMDAATWLNVGPALIKIAKDSSMGTCAKNEAESTPGPSRSQPDKVSLHAGPHQANNIDGTAAGETTLKRKPSSSSISQRKTLGTRRDLVGWQPGSRQFRAGARQVGTPSPSGRERLQHGAKIGPMCGPVTCASRNANQ